MSRRCTLSVALVTDNEDIRRRALPMTEYLLSRENILRRRPSHQAAESVFLRGPAAEVSELPPCF